MFHGIYLQKVSWAHGHIGNQKTEDDAVMLITHSRHPPSSFGLFLPGRNQQLKESYEIKLQTLQDRLSALQQEYDNNNDDRLHHMDTINSLTKKLQQAEQEKDGFHRKFMKEVRKGAVCSLGVSC